MNYLIIDIVKANMNVLFVDHIGSPFNSPPDLILINSL